MESFRKPISLIAALFTLPLLLLAGDNSPIPTKLDVHLTGLDPQFISPKTGSYEITTLTLEGNKAHIPVLLDRHTGRTWLFSLDGTTANPAMGWIPIPFYGYNTNLTTKLYPAPAAAIQATDPKTK
jgi:hypothetical protein